jgi:hypothetical protein
MALESKLLKPPNGKGTTENTKDTERPFTAENAENAE